MTLEHVLERALSRLTEISIDSGDATPTITINDYSALALDTVTVTIGGTAHVLTEGTDWNRGASNTAAATSLAAAINALTGVSASSSAAVVTITAPENITSLAVSDAVNMILLDSSLTTIVDTTKNWGTDMWKDAIVEVEVDDVHYYRIVASNTATTLTIGTLPAGHPVAAGAHYNIRLSTRMVQISGQAVIISGQPVTISSGHIQVVSGEVIARISGQPVTISSGAISVVSGYVAVVSGEVIARVSGQPVTISSGHIQVVSGQVIARISGQPVTISSGHIHVVSGQVIAKVSGETVKISGETVDIQVPTSVQTGAVLHPTAASGGTIATSGAVKAAIFKSLSGEVYLGGQGLLNRPYPNYGFLLAAGEAVSLDIDNFGRVRICAITSGDPVSFIGVH